jgi:hypothetical protein
MLIQQYSVLKNKEGTTVSFVYKSININKFWYNNILYLTNKENTTVFLNTKYFVDGIPYILLYILFITQQDAHY